MYGYARGLTDSDPAKALDWAQRISQPDLRDRAVVETVSDWMRYDAVNATEWLRGSTLSPELKLKVGPVRGVKK